jgi:SWI/SNF-related matrix-associated actin-dependent regulator 1 of chromatin subfamily A
LKRLAAEAKLAPAREWMRDFLESGRKLVVFGWHVRIVNSVADDFADGVKIQGGQTQQRRQEFVDLFQDSPDQRVIACQINAAGVGLTLTAASDVLFLEQGWTPADMDQAADRCHRIGQRDSVTAWNMLCSGTVDELIADLIERKRKLVDAATEGGEVVATASVLGDVLVELATRGLTN